MWTFSRELVIEKARGKFHVKLFFSYNVIIQGLYFTLRQETVTEKVTKNKFSTEEELKPELEKLLLENSRNQQITKLIQTNSSAAQHLNTQVNVLTWCITRRVWRFPFTEGQTALTKDLMSIWSHRNVSICYWSALRGRQNSHNSSKVQLVK